MTDLRITELSGRWNRSASKMLRDIRKAARDSDIILLTEVKDGRRPSALQRMKQSGWTVSQDRDPWDHAESAILTRNTKWDVVEFKAHVLHRNIGQGGPVIAAVAVLRDVETGKVFIPSITHAPSAVEGNWGGRAAAAHRASIRCLRRVHRDLRREYRPDGEAAFADWNLNLHRPWVRAWIRAAWPELTVPRRQVIPLGATHAGGRLIDWFVRRGWSVDSWRILPATDASDHRGIYVTGSFLPRRRSKNR